ncbi:hypothetical protein [Photorhabdus laumondii]|uniref:hypothetical protein n=1 Tax=Photorhabdus laumondii TaxID=2218628 RepID=UPI0025B22CC2|nr:hypothetical protein [Photorhabdus laumondii]
MNIQSTTVIGSFENVDMESFQFYYEGVTYQTEFCVPAYETYLKVLTEIFGLRADEIDSQKIYSYIKNKYAHYDDMELSRELAAFDTINDLSKKQFWLLIYSRGDIGVYIEPNDYICLSENNLIEKDCSINGIDYYVESDFGFEITKTMVAIMAEYRNFIKQVN